MRRAPVKTLGVVVLALSLLSTSCRGGDDKNAATTTAVTTASQRSVELGIAAQSKNDPDAAMKHYQKALELDPTNKFAHYNVGTLLQARADITGASDAYEKALAIDANYRPALYNLAILREPFAPDSSEELYNRILAINPEDANVFLHLGLLQLKRGKTAEAEANLAKAVELDPKLQAQVDAAR